MSRFEIALGKTSAPPPPVAKGYPGYASDTKVFGPPRLNNIDQNYISLYTWDSQEILRIAEDGFFVHGRRVENFNPNLDRMVYHAFLTWLSSSGQYAIAEETKRAIDTELNKERDELLNAILDTE